MADRGVPGVRRAAAQRDRLGPGVLCQPQAEGKLQQQPGAAEPSLNYFFYISSKIFSQVEPLAARELTDCLPDADPSPNIGGGQEVAFGSGLDTVPGGEEFRNRWVVLLSWGPGSKIVRSIKFSNWY